MDADSTDDRRCRPTPTSRAAPGPTQPAPRDIPPDTGAETASTPPMPDDVAASPLFRRGVELFNAGYYWEAHEAWEALWHAAGRRGPTADLLKGLIKLAAAGVKVRERQEHGVGPTPGAPRSASPAREQGGGHQLGLDLDVWIERALAIAESPPTDPGPPDARRHPRLRVPDRSIGVAVRR